MADTLTMMAVHAHPDDEASSTGGVLATYSGQGIRTVVVTCTNGELGDGHGGIKPGQDGHDEQAVVRQRLAELRESCAILGVSDLELLGYRDSGMPDWDYKGRADAFCNIPQAKVAARISGLIERYRPQVLITYDDQGPYQHPDHVHASRCAQAAFADTGIPAKLYLSAMRGSSWRRVREALRELGADVPDWPDPDPEAAAAGPGVRAAHHHHGGHPAGGEPQEQSAVRARQPGFRVVVQQATAGDRRGDLRVRELHPGQRQHRSAAA